MRSVRSLFDISKGHQLALNRVTPAVNRRDAVAYVARSHRNNGITAWVLPVPGLEPAAAGTISVCLRSRNHALAAFVQPTEFYTTYHVAILTPKRVMSLQEKLWWCLCIRANRFRFNFGRQANRTIGDLFLPEKVPHWVHETPVPDHERGRTPDSTENVDTSSWERFKLSELFAFYPGQHASRRKLGNGETRFVSASAWRNGVSGEVGVPADWHGGQITVANNGSIGAAFYQPSPFTASRDVTVLVPKVSLTTAAALFICTIIRKEGERYSYARKWTIGRMKEAEIHLPARGDAPDFAAMEKFMLSLRLGWALK